MILRDYQRRAVDAIGRCLSEFGSSLLVLPTGTGKTVVFAAAIQEHCKGRALVLAHREELIAQNARTIGTILGETCDIERGAQHADLPGGFDWDGRGSHKARVIVASKDSLHPSRLARFDPREFGMVVTDESHHATARSYSRIYEHFAGVPHLGVTATPDRLDKEALGQVYESVAMTYEIADAIRDGWLVPVRAHTVYVKDLNLSQVGTVASDLNQGELAEQLERERVVHEIAASITRECEDRRALVFTVSVRGAQQLADVLNDYRADCARMVCGETPTEERAAIFAAHKRNEFQFLTNVGVATEGYDDPGCGMIVMARPTKSRALFAQMLGRGTRPLPGVVDGDPRNTDFMRRASIAASAKPNTLCLDFTGNCGKHKLVTPADVLGGKYSQAERDAASAALLDGADVNEALEAARQAAINDRDPIRKEWDGSRARIIASARYLLHEEDLFDGAFGPERQREFIAGKAPTENQLDTLERHGFARDDAARMSRSECSRLIGQIVARVTRGLATTKQVAALVRRGVKIDPATCTFAEARGHLDRVFGRVGV